MSWKLSSQLDVGSFHSTCLTLPTSAKNFPSFIYPRVQKMRGNFQNSRLLGHGSGGVLVRRGFSGWYEYKPGLHLYS